MKRDDWKHEFPEMPEEMRRMIEDKVREQVNGSVRPARRSDADTGARPAVRRSDADTGARPAVRRGMRPRRLAVLVAAAVLAVGMTAFAGMKLYQFYTEQVGTYGVKTQARLGAQTTGDGEMNAGVGNYATGEDAADRGVNVVQNAAAENDAEGSAAQTVRYENATLRAEYLPAGMVEAEGGLQWYYEDEPYVGGLSGVLYKIEENDTFKVLDRRILSREEITVNGHEGVCLTRKANDGGNMNFDRIFYVFYPEAGFVLQLYAAENVSQEETLKFLDGLTVTENATSGEEPKRRILWSDYVELMNQEPETDILEPQYTASHDEMASVHAVGDTFRLAWASAVKANGESCEEGVIDVTVAEVQLADNLSLLKPEYTDQMLRSQTDSDGNLLASEIRYVKAGDGIDTLEETVQTETAVQKLAYVTVKFENTGNEPLYDLCYFGMLKKISETEEGYAFYDRRTSSGVDCDMLTETGLTSYSEMTYFDVKSSGGHNGSNYIDELLPGEPVTVHIGFLVAEDELDYLYFTLNGGMEGFTDELLGGLVKLF